MRLGNHNYNLFIYNFFIIKICKDAVFSVPEDIIYKKMVVDIIDVIGDRNRKTEIMKMINR